MSDAKILEKVLRRSRRVRYSGGARSEHEDRERGWTSLTPRLPSVSFSGLKKRRFGILPLHESSGDRKAKTPFEKNGKVAAYRLLLAAVGSCEGHLSLILNK
jgi:hypothetical protein